MSADEKLLVEPEAETLPTPNTPELKYMAAITERLGVMIEQQALLIEFYTKGSEPEPGSGRSMKLMDGSVVNF